MIGDLRLQNFRSYKDDSFEFDKSVNIIVGPNASGKTSLLEALLVLSTGGSYKARHQELIRHGADWARLDGHYGKIKRTVKIETSGARIESSFEIDSKKFKRLTQDKTLPVVLFEPNHLRLLNGQPEGRREFLDNLLVQTEPGFKQLSNQYKRTLAQRNALLKNGSRTRDQLFAWNIRLSELGSKIARHRGQIITEINSNLTQHYTSLTGGKVKLSAEYQSTLSLDNYSSQMLHKLEASETIDYQRGFTSCGPHRDDMAVSMDKYSAAETASRGEMRTILLSLKIIELKIIEAKRGQKPFLLLDDVFSELDGARRRALTEFLNGYQTFITTTDADIVVQHFLDRCNVIALSN